ncbi:hypothetical protein FC093_21160 [Ilyomonas limi]|uniref:Glycosyltransferase family 1 protein n=1 Tax=Ilyomonas limi TaxID=2575867 RepID=A0A4U3KRI0_9BACT|nr:hypothetical protein [Ilyomonas limi]TKK65015.1 hypothetical protein FC093_21160 [Ilyomonas limi]
MKPLFDCTIEYLKSPHLQQLYTGFFELQKRGIAQLHFTQKNKSADATAITTVIINNKYKVIYDAIDGLSWIKGTEEENLLYFQKNFKADFYFKRSYSPKMLAYAPEGCTVLPLGFNYNMQPRANLLRFNNSLPEKIKYILKTGNLTKRFFGKSFFYAKDFEQAPLEAGQDKVLFITRLWNPDEAKSEPSRVHRQSINAMRVACIEMCRKKYGKQFTGGLIKDAFSAKHYPQLLLPDELTCKKGYLNTTKKHAICVATTGLHNSTGWKMAEYVAASKAIVSEPLHFELPGNFEKNTNYLEFTTVDELINKIDYLLQNKTALLQMMQNNHRYYHHYVKPDVLVLNTLNKIVAPKQEDAFIQQAVQALV